MPNEWHRSRAVLEERDADDLRRNALTELQDILGPDGGSSENATGEMRASFFRFFDAQGELLTPENEVDPPSDQAPIEEKLSRTGTLLSEVEDQSIPLHRCHPWQ